MSNFCFTQVEESIEDALNLFVLKSSSYYADFLPVSQYYCLFLIFTL